MQLRLDKYLADLSVDTRSKVKLLIRKGRVRVNNEIAKKPETKIDTETDTVTVDGRKLVYHPFEYYMLNKPAGVLSAARDKKQPTVLDLIESDRKDLFPVGRLDYTTTGLLIMTNDGDLTYTLTHPKHEVYKTYVAVVAGVLSDSRVAKLRKGVDIGGFVTSPAKVKVIKQLPRRAVVEIKIREGKNRQVRKMFAAAGNRVQELKRTAIGDIPLGRLMEGHYRKLSREEIEYLKSL